MAATITMGLMAGLFYAFACSVLPGLGRADDRTFIEAMQRINAAILNGWFALGFVGALGFTALAALLHLRADGRRALPWIVAALLLYGVALALTFTVNVPRNNALAAAGPPDRIADVAVVRRSFEAAWMRANIARAVACTAGVGCLAWALALAGPAAPGQS